MKSEKKWKWDSWEKGFLIKDCFDLNVFNKLEHWLILIVGVNGPLLKALEFFLLTKGEKV